MKNILKDFNEKIKNQKTEISQLQNAYLQKYAENLVVKQLFNDIRDKVLQEGYFYAAMSCKRSSSGNTIAAGDRIINHSYDWLLSEKSFDEYQAQCKTLFIESGLTDEKGYYTEQTNTEKQLEEIKEKIIRLSMEIIPDNLPNKNLLKKAVEYKGRNWYQTREKLFELFMKI